MDERIAIGSGCFSPFSGRGGKIRLRTYVFGSFQNKVRHFGAVGDYDILGSILGPPQAESALLLSAVRRFTRRGQPAC